MLKVFMKRGFTLIEMLVVLSIVALVAMAIGASLSSGLKAWDSARNFGEYELNAATAFRIMEKDLANLIEIKDVPFKGESGRVMFPARVLAGRANEELNREPGTVEYFIDPEGGILRRKVAGIISEFGTEDRGEVLARGLQSLSLEYMVFVDKEAKDATWVENWNDSTNMPLSVRIELRSVDPARSALRRVMNIPARPPGGDA